VIIKSKYCLLPGPRRVCKGHGQVGVLDGYATSGYWDERGTSAVSVSEFQGLKDKTMNRALNRLLLRNDSCGSHGGSATDRYLRDAETSGFAKGNRV
jgi:hypothetical protein